MEESKIVTMGQYTKADFGFHCWKSAEKVVPGTVRIIDGKLHYANNCFAEGWWRRRYETWWYLVKEEHTEKDAR